MLRVYLLHNYKGQCSHFGIDECFYVTSDSRLLLVVLSALRLLNCSVHVDYNHHISRSTKTLIRQ